MGLNFFVLKMSQLYAFTFSTVLIGILLIAFAFGYLHAQTECHIRLLTWKLHVLEHRLYTLELAGSHKRSDMLFANLQSRITYKTYVVDTFLVLVV